MRRLLLFLSVLLLTIAMLGADNLQKTFTTRDDVYQRVDALCRRNGVLGPSSFSPVSGRVLQVALERLDFSSLSPSDKAEYQELMGEIAGGDMLFSVDGFAFDLPMGVNLAVNVADYDSHNYESGPYHGGFTKDRRGDELIPYHLQDPALWIWPQFHFGDNIYLEGDFAIRNNSRRMYETSFGWLLSGVSGKTSVFGSYGSALAPELPYLAGGSIGNDFVSFIIGRYPHSIGGGITGNLVVGDNFNYQEIANLSFISNWFSYNISFTHFDAQRQLEGLAPHLIGFTRNEFSGPQQFRVVHRFDANLFDRFRLALDLATLYCSDNGFDLRFFSPFMIAHNYFNYANWVNREKYDEANNSIGIEAELVIVDGLSIYVQGIIDQFQMYFEDKTDLPAAWGVQGNLKYSTPIAGGTLDAWFETTYTNPYLYLNKKYDASTKGDFDYNLDYIVGYHTQYLDDYGFSGYVYGPDSIVFSLGGEYVSAERDWNIGLSAFLRIQGQNVVRHRYHDHQLTYIDVSQALLDEDFSLSDDTSTPTGGWDNAEYLFKVDLTGGYTFSQANLEIYGGIGLNTYFNYENMKGETRFVPQAVIGLKWYGLDWDWFR